MTEEERIQFNNLKIELEELKSFVYKDKFSNLEIFRKQVEFLATCIFKGTVDLSIGTLSDVTTISKTGGIAPISNGGHSVSIPAGGGSFNINTLNGIITSIT